MKRTLPFSTFTGSTGSLVKQIIVALILGIAVGVFFMAERCFLLGGFRKFLRLCFEGSSPGFSVCSGCCFYR